MFLRIVFSGKVCPLEETIKNAISIIDNSFFMMCLDKKPPKRLSLLFRKN